MLQVVEHHVGVVDVVLGVLCEAVAVVPLAHHLQGRVHVLVERPVVAVGLEQAADLRLREAEHLVELRLEADVGADVEAAGHVVHRDGRDAGDEQPLQAARLPCAGLQGGEEVAVEAAAMGERLVRLLATMREHGVGEVVVLVDEHAERNVVVTGIF